MICVFTDVFDERKHENAPRQAPEGNGESPLGSGIHVDRPPMRGKSFTGLSFVLV